MSHSKAKESYRNASFETASPGKIILLLYDGALKFINAAKTGFEEEEVGKSCEIINNNLIRAIEIIAELKAALDFSVDGKFSKTMADLYEYMEFKLNRGNIKKELEPVLEAEKCLQEIRDAWAEMLGKQESPPENTTGLSCSA